MAQAVTGTLYGVGVGPGDPELLTVKAARLIAACPVIAYPAPDDGDSFARSIVADRLGAQEEIVIRVPMRRERHPARDVYDEAAERIAVVLDGGRDVCALCEGDPFFYGSFMYLFERLVGRFPTQVVPGVSSVMAAAAAMERPLAARGETLCVVPATNDDETIRKALREHPALAFIKVGRHWPRLRTLIEEAGLSAQGIYAERVSLPNQKISSVEEATDAAPYFSLVLVYRGAEGWAA